MKNQNRRRIKEFGDFQTPPELAHSIVNFLKANGVNPATIVEPTCGTGSFVLASINTFPDAAIIGIDINSNYVNFLNNILTQKTKKKNINIKQGDFFKEDWNKMINLLQEPILTVGNPPWITSATMTLIDGDNLPIKTNIHEFSGIEAKTGKSNFDISEWVIITLLKSLNGHHGILAMICKTSVARKALIYCNRNELSISNASMHLINGKKYFNVTVDICLFICHLIPNFQNYTCQIYPNLNYRDLIHEIGIIDNELIADIPNYQKWKHSKGKQQNQ